MIDAPLGYRAENEIRTERIISSFKINFISPDA